MHTPTSTVTITENTSATAHTSAGAGVVLVIVIQTFPAGVIYKRAKAIGFGVRGKAVLVLRAWRIVVNVHYLVVFFYASMFPAVILKIFYRA